MNNLLKTAFAEGTATVTVENHLDAAVSVETFNADVLSISEAQTSMENAYIVEEELQGVANGLEAIVNSLEAHAETGIDATAATFLTLAVSAHTTRLGIENAPVASVENFGGATDSLEATDESKGSIKKTLSKVLKVLGDAIRKGMRKVGEFFSSLFKGIDSVIKRLDAVADEAKKAPTTLKDAEAKLTIPAGPRLHFEGNLDASSIATGLDNLATVWSEQTGILEQVAGVVYSGKLKKLLADLEGTELSEEDAGKAISEIGDEISGFVSNGTKDGVTISGGYGVVTKGEEGAEAKIVLPTLQKVKELEKVAETSKADAFAAAEIAKILSSAKTVANGLKGQKKLVEGVKKQREEALKLVDEAIKAADKGKFKSAWAAGKARTAVGFTNKGIDKCVNALAAHGFQVVRATIALAEANTKMYGEPKAAKKEGEE